MPYLEMIDPHRSRSKGDNRANPLVPDRIHGLPDAGQHHSNIDTYGAQIPHQIGMAAAAHVDYRLLYSGDVKLKQLHLQLWRIFFCTTLPMTGEAFSGSSSRSETKERNQRASWGNGVLEGLPVSRHFPAWLPGLSINFQLLQLPGIDPEN